MESPLGDSGRSRDAGSQDWGERVPGVGGEDVRGGAEQEWAGPIDPSPERRWTLEPGGRGDQERREPPRVQA